MNTVNLFLSALPHSPHFLPRAAQELQSPLSMGELSHEKSLMNAPRKEPVLRGPDLSGQALQRGLWGPARTICPRATHRPGGAGAEAGPPGLKTTLPFSGNGVWVFTLSLPCSPYAVHQQEQTKPETGNSPTSCATQPPSQTPEGQAGP